MPLEALDLCQCFGGSFFFLLMCGFSFCLSHMCDLRQRHKAGATWVVFAELCTSGNAEQRSGKGKRKENWMLINVDAETLHVSSSFKSLFFFVCLKKLITFV